LSRNRLDHAVPGSDFAPVEPTASIRTATGDAYEPRPFARHSSLGGCEWVIEHLGQPDFLHAREDVVLLGPPRTDKTHLAIALCIRACLAGQGAVQD
jgi:hypothetical protein